MKNRIRIGVLLGVAALFLMAAGRWDGNFQRWGTITTTVAATPTSVVVPTGAYVKVECPNVAPVYVGAGSGTGFNCVPLDGGPNVCGMTQFQMGEKYYAQLPGTSNRISAFTDGGATTCTIFVGN